MELFVCHLIELETAIIWYNQSQQDQISLSGSGDIIYRQKGGSAMLTVLNFFISVIRDFVTFVFGGVAQRFSAFIEKLSTMTYTPFVDGHLSTGFIAIMFVIMFIVVLFMAATKLAIVFFPLVLLNTLIMLIGFVFFKRPYCAFMGMQETDRWMFFICAGILPFLFSGALGGTIVLPSVVSIHMLASYLFRFLKLITIPQFEEMIDFTLDICTIYVAPLFLICLIFLRITVVDDSDGDNNWMVFW